MLTLERVNTLLRDQLGDGFEWSEDTELAADREDGGLALDSLDLVETVLRVEEEFGLQITDDEAAQVRTVGDIVNLVDAKLA